MDSVVRISMNTEHLEKQQTVLSAVGSCAGSPMRTNPQPTADVNTCTLFPPRRVRPDAEQRVLMNSYSAERLLYHISLDLFCQGCVSIS